VEKQDMTFTSAGAQLSGTLYYPKGRPNLGAVVILHAAGEPSRDAPLYLHLKQMLPSLGIAVFVYDRRGTGRSGGGEHGKEDFDVLSSDGVAAFRMLTQDPRVDAKRIGFWGLSQGGWLTLLAAKKEPRAAFAIASSAPMVSADVQMNFATANILTTKGYPRSTIDQAIGARRAVDNYIRGKTDRASAERALHSVEQQPWFKLIYLKGNIDDPDWRQQISSDPMRSVEGTRVPTLLIYGQDDMWIPVADTARLLNATKTKHANITTKIISGATHEMMLGTNPKDEMDPALFPNFAPNAPEYFGVMSAWLGERGIAKAEFK
jgi:dienelactone hydrolase